jgi:uncharacterized Fe-S cluster-containing radical SAM superfamily protein
MKIIKEVYCWNWSGTKAKRMNDGKVFTYEQIAKRLREAQESMGEWDIEFRHPLLTRIDDETEKSSGSTVIDLDW